MFIPLTKTILDKNVRLERDKAMAYQSEKESAFKKLLKENKSLAFMLPVLAILVIILILVYSGVFNKKEAPAALQPTPTTTVQPEESALAQQPQVDVLPQIIRSSTEGAIDVVKDPFETPMKLVGVIFSNERSTAIVESGGVSYIVKVDDTIGDSTWKVDDIQKDSLTIEANGKSVTLELTESVSTSDGQ